MSIIMDNELKILYKFNHYFKKINSFGESVDLIYIYTVVKIKWSIFKYIMNNL